MSPGQHTNLKALIEKARGDFDREAAYKQISDAIDDYLRHKPIVDEGRRKTAGIAEARQHLGKLDELLSKADNLLGDLPLNAQILLGEAYVNRFSLQQTSSGLDDESPDTGCAPLGKLRHELGQIKNVVAAARQTAKRTDDKTPDHARNVLAYRIARTIRDVMKQKPTMSVPDPDFVTGTRNGALYGRLLEAALHTAGLGSSDLRPTLKAGLDLLIDPDLP